MFLPVFAILASIIFFIVAIVLSDSRILRYLAIAMLVINTLITGILIADLLK